ncbi:MAG: sulfonate transport system permease protein [Mycobacterium sp.]|jgi:NitT/TauT family transport system permease protein|nr:sulfonate transport system permease protein [Mycobacterium sp.]
MSTPMASRETRRADALRRGAAGVLVAGLAWELATRLREWAGVAVPMVSQLPPPTAVAADFLKLAVNGGYWNSWSLSFQRVLVGFAAALVVGGAYGLLMATRPRFKQVVFPVFESLRPIPPLAWVPLAILFWPTQELSITFVTFLGALFPIVLNTVGGAEQIDRRHVLTARSMGAGRGYLFRRVLLPALLPSLLTGAAVGMGITWEVVVAAELISGGGQQSGDGGLGFLVWNAYQGNDLSRVVVGMVSLGIAGYLSSGFVRMLGNRLMPWRRASA